MKKKKQSNETSERERETKETQVNGIIHNGHDMNASLNAIKISWAEFEANI